jgi:hypothetical protein
MAGAKWRTTPSIIAQSSEGVRFNDRVPCYTGKHIVQCGIKLSVNHKHTIHPVL